MTKAQPPPDFPPDAPYGTHPRRPAGPLFVLIVVFAAWFSFLVWIALKYPAR